MNLEGMDLTEVESHIKRTKKCPICSNHIDGYKVNVGSSKYPVVHNFAYCSSCNGYLLACWTCDAFYTTKNIEKDCPVCGPQEVLNSMYITI